LKEIMTWKPVSEEDMQQYIPPKVETVEEEEEDEEEDTSVSTVGIP
jgi:hypothetical protein